MMVRRPLIPSLFPYTTLFRSVADVCSGTLTDTPWTSLNWALMPGNCRSKYFDLQFPGINARSEEHTSELQSHSDLVCRLLLEKKKKNKKTNKMKKKKYTVLEV